MRADVGLSLWQNVSNWRQTIHDIGSLGALLWLLELEERADVGFSAGQNVNFS